MVDRVEAVRVLALSLYVGPPFAGWRWTCEKTGCQALSGIDEVVPAVLLLFVCIMRTLRNWLSL